MSIELDGLQFLGNQVEGCGGAVFIAPEEACGTEARSVTIEGSHFEGNRALPAEEYCLSADEGGEGGGLAGKCLDIQIRSTHFVGNEAQHGGGVFLYTPNTPSPLDVEDCDFQANLAEVAGGAIKVRGVEVNIIRSEFSNNDASNSGGAIMGDGGPLMTLAQVRMYNNRAIGEQGNRGDGGAISATYDVLDLSYVDLRGNYANRYGGAIELYGDVQMDHVIMADNVAEAGPGGLLALESLVASHITLHGNRGRVGVDGFQAGESLYASCVTATAHTDALIRGPGEGTCEVEDLNVVDHHLQDNQGELEFNNLIRRPDEEIGMGTCSGNLMQVDPDFISAPSYADLELSDPEDWLFSLASSSSLIGACSNGDDIGAYDGTSNDERWDWSL